VANTDKKRKVVVDGGWLWKPWLLFCSTGKRLSGTQIKL